MKGAEPIFLPGKKKIGVLLYHGWSSSPQELNPEYVESTAKYLNKMGYTVYVPLRLGHGTTPEDFQGIRWEDWLEDARSHYRWFEGKVDKIVVGGMSMGSNLALHMAIEKDVVGIIAMGTPIFFKAHPISALFAWLNRNNTRMREKRYLAADRAIASKKVHYSLYPNYHLYENLKSSRDTRALLHKVTVPALVMHSSNDNVAHPISARYVYNQIRSKDKKLIFIKDSYHSFTTDLNVHIANEAIVEFLDKLE